MLTPDAEDVAAWRAAELHAQGKKFHLVARAVRRRDGSYLYTVECLEDGDQTDLNVGNEVVVDDGRYHFYGRIADLYCDRLGYKGAVVERYPYRFAIDAGSPSVTWSGSIRCVSRLL